MITHIFGLPKKGKTALLTYFAVMNMFGDAAETAVRNCRKYVRVMNAGGFRLTVPDKHLVYADFDITAYRDGSLPRKNHTTSGFRIGIGDDCPFPIDFFPPYSTICLSEAQTYWDCHIKTLNPYTVRFLQFHGHRKLNIFVDSQRYDGLYKDFRQLTERYIEVLSVEVVYRKGKLCTVWRVHEFFGVNAVEAYFSGDKDYPVTKIVYEGNIFRSYDAFDRDSDFIAGHYNEDFTRGRAITAGNDISSVSARNVERSITAPSGYYDAPNAKK